MFKVSERSLRPCTRRSQYSLSRGEVLLRDDGAAVPFGHKEQDEYGPCAIPPPRRGFRYVRTSARNPATMRRQYRRRGSTQWAPAWSGCHDVSL